MHSFTDPYKSSAAHAALSGSLQPGFLFPGQTRHSEEERDVESESITVIGRSNTCQNVSKWTFAPAETCMLSLWFCRTRISQYPCFVSLFSLFVPKDQFEETLLLLLIAESMVSCLLVLEFFRLSRTAGLVSEDSTCESCWCDTLLEVEQDPPP